MKRIRFFRNVPHVIDESRLVPLPIPPYPYILEEEAELIVRLRSTRGGNSARWIARKGAVQALNAAPYNPVIRAIVRGFAWAPPKTRDCPSMLEYSREEPSLVVQLGSGVVNWRAYVVRPIPDPVRGVIQAAWAAVREQSPSYTQGQLNLWVASREVGEAARGLKMRRGSGNRWVYNHLFTGHAGLVFRVIDTEHGPMAVGLLQVDRVCHILSPDHPEEPISLLYGATFVFTHPLPREDVD